MRAAAALMRGLSDSEYRLASQLMLGQWLRCERLGSLYFERSSSLGQRDRCFVAGTVGSRGRYRVTPRSSSSSAGGIPSALHTFKNSTTSRLRSPFSYLETNDCGRRSRFATSDCVSPAA